LIADLLYIIFLFHKNPVSSHIPRFDFMDQGN
jgi:hypothetical protein